MILFNKLCDVVEKYEKFQTLIPLFKKCRTLSLSDHTSIYQYKTTERS